MSIREWLPLKPRLLQELVNFLRQLDENVHGVGGEKLNTSHVVSEVFLATYGDTLKGWDMRFVSV